MKNLILGCGPAGLIAAHALDTSGETFSIFSRRKQSILGGAQFLHEPIPYLTEHNPDAIVTYLLRGSADGYRAKLYGSMTDVPFVSMENVEHEQQIPAWNLRRVYQRLWERYQTKIVHIEDISHDHVVRWQQEFDTIFSTIPAPTVCINTDQHWFRSQCIRIWPWSKADNAFASNLADNVVIYNGEDSPTWYRSSLLWGTGGTEWAATARLPAMEPMITVHKPIATNCDCLPTVHRLGRFGLWRKGILTHDAWADVIKVVGVH